MARRCMAPERVEGNVSHGRCSGLPKHFAVVLIGTVPLAVWFCPDHVQAAFYPDATPDCDNCGSTTDIDPASGLCPTCLHTEDS